ncbi:MAG TPA: hypothetical protein VFB59_05635 [Candidatus Saccharimonadales bacterium]|nr:hypothetical protein [Candidatus Saccharimonadales bacterium]
MIEVITFAGDGLPVVGPKWEPTIAPKLRHDWRPLDPGIHPLDNEDGRMVITNRLVVTLDGEGVLTVPPSQGFEEFFHSLYPGGSIEEGRMPITRNNNFHSVFNALTGDVIQFRKDVRKTPKHIFSFFRLTGLIRYNPDLPTAKP